MCIVDVQIMQGPANYHRIPVSVRPLGVGDDTLGLPTQQATVLARADLAQAQSYSG